MSVQIENKNAEKVAGNAFEKAELRYVDPRTVKFGTNVRSDVEKTIDVDFVDSIRDLGVRVPPPVYEDQDGTLTLVDGGARRTWGAIKAGLALYPVIVVPSSNGSSALDRLVNQFHENDQRAGINDADRTAGYQQMALFGATAAQIAKRTKTTTAKVKAALGVAESKTARAAQVKYDLTIDQAATLTEFVDHPKIVAKLTEVATSNPGQFAHEAQRQRDTLQRVQELAQARQALREAGVREIPNPGYGNKKITRLGDLADAQGNRLTEETHRTCPGHAAYLDEYSRSKVAYVCTDPRANKHAKDGRVLGVPLSGKEKAERDAVREFNPRWESATDVRRKWLADFAKKTTAPKGADEFIAMSVLQEGGSLDKAGNTGHAMAAEWLGIKNAGYGARTAIGEMIAKAAKAGRPGRVQRITLVLALAAIEARTSKATWRSTREARYFLALRDFGYDLDKVEEIAAGLRTAIPDDRTLQSAEANDAPKTSAPVKAATASVSADAATKATSQSAGQVAAKPANDGPARATSAKAKNAEKAQPARSPRKAATTTASTTPEANPSPTAQGAAKQEPVKAQRPAVKPQEQKTASVPQPAAAGSL
ncbi:hypothetical protein GCM10010413_36920 [Promicromonospora sukumoe]|uniref:ParB family chromosome partitioning protein n=1 Tax=Promicromonospora sukumoe TaxID=88382 RepID=A0A7W3J799_9MICO|nr:hypothetical protein [Promicromonospora sukumoe]MBA8807632.1 ParB family chromosome partitioning protein [Promicromonospora sukumoe]